MAQDTELDWTMDQVRCARAPAPGSSNELRSGFLGRRDYFFLFGSTGAPARARSCPETTGNMPAVQAVERTCLLRASVIPGVAANSSHVEPSFTPTPPSSSRSSRQSTWTQSPAASIEKGLRCKARSPGRQKTTIRSWRVSRSPQSTKRNRLSLGSFASSSVLTAARRRLPSAADHRFLPRGAEGWCERHQGALCIFSAIVECPISVFLTPLRPETAPRTAPLTPLAVTPLPLSPAPATPQTCAEQMKAEKAQRGIIVIRESMTAFARQSLAETEKSKLHIEQFNESELLVNITEHSLVPKHEILSGEKREAKGPVLRQLAARLDKPSTQLDAALGRAASGSLPNVVCEPPRSPAAARPRRRGEEAASRPLSRAAAPAAANPDERPGCALLRAQERPGALGPRSRKTRASHRLCWCGL